MSNPATRRRSRSHIETEDEADAARFGREVSPATSDGSKRMRLRGGRGAPSHAEMEDDDGGDPESSDEFQQTNVSLSRANRHIANNGASATEFSAGAIVRVMVKNFVTYEKAEFFPGPNLNMVIGPNGTGKSSLVCAICLGLGYPASVLGRATSFGEFVKHGKEDAIVEIELQKRPQDRENYVVKLRINREDNTRQFWLNGKSVTHKIIQKVMQKLRIQIDNLCQFLPQDKVAEFAGLNSIELLNKTLQAAAPEEMIEQQGELREMFDQQKKMQRDLETEAEKLRGWQTRQQGLQADVERLREREQIQKVVADLKDARVFREYMEKKEQFLQIKEQRKRAQKHVHKLERRFGPSFTDVMEKEKYKDQVDTVLEARKLHAKDAESMAEKAFKAVDKVNDDIKDVENHKQTERTSLNTKRQQVSKQRTKIAQLEAQIKNTDIESKFNPAEWNHKIREQENRLNNEIREEIDKVTSDKERIKVQGQEKMAELKAIQRDIDNLDSQEGQRLVQLTRMDPDAANAYRWLQEHRNEFEKEVFGPPMLTCSMKEKRYSNHVQSLLQRDDFLCFTAQTKNDHKKLTDQLYSNRMAVAVRTITSDLSTFRPPIPRQGLGDLGLDGYALDFIEGPEPVLAMLCSEKKIHLTGVALKEVNEQQYQRINEAEVINSFAAGNTYYRITRRREYGPGATSTFSKTIQRGRYWTDEPLDATAKAELDQRHKECLEIVAELKKQLTEAKAKEEALGEQTRDIEAERDRLKKEKEQLQREYNRWKSLPDKIDVEKKSLQAAEEELRKTKQKLSAYDDDLDKLVLKRAGLVIRHQELLIALRDAGQAVVEAETRFIEAVSDYAALQEQNSDIAQRLNEEKKKVEDLSREAEKAKAETHAAHSAVLEVLNTAGEVDAERRDYLMEISNGKTVESITEDIEIEMAKLEVIQDADPGVLRDFEKRAKDIERLQAESATRQASMEQLSEKIKNLREVWEPGLDELIRRINDAFSYNFEQISCAGEVGVHKDEDFDKWAIEIKVKFRENETLQKLDQHRQSGGERAVSTIFYLMSLQSMAQSPFRVVDEINQGMDPRNERMVHERMVEIACREHTSQYFLITPKLLSDLRYDERMKVLCIASGKYMPEEGSKLDFARCVKIKRQLLAAASA